MPRAIDLGDTGGIDLSHDPNKQISSDSGLNRGIDKVGLNILTIPKLIIQAILGGLGGLLNPLTAIETALGFLTGWAGAIKDLLSGVAPIIGSGLESWFSGGGPFGGVAGFFEMLRGVPTKLTEHTEAITRLDELAAASNSTVAYVGDLQDMVTIPRSQLVCVGEAGNKGQNVLAAVSTGSGSQHTDLTTRAMPYFRPGASGSIYYVPIVTDRLGIPDKIRWIGGTDNSIFSGTYYEVAVCGYNPTNGNVEKIWGSGNIKDTYANTSTLAEIQIDMGLDDEDVAQRIKPGQLLFFCHQQYANGFGQSARSVAAAPQSNVARPAGLLLNAACYEAPNYSQGIPSSIPFASLSRENRFIPWGAISVKSIPVEVVEAP